jgi:hypothetical protein
MPLRLATERSQSSFTHQPVVDSASHDLKHCGESQPTKSRLKV